MPTTARPTPRTARAAPRADARLAPHADAPVAESEETPYACYLRTLPDGLKGDLIHGEAVIEMSASVAHELVFMFLARLVGGYVEERGLGVVLGSRTLMKVDDENGYEPDLLFVRADRTGIIGDVDVTERVDLAVEIVSRTSGRRDRETKFEGYQRLGVPEYWLVDPLRGEAAFYGLGEDGVYRAVPLVAGIFESTVLPGFRLDPQALFGETLPPTMPLLLALLADAPAAGDPATGDAPADEEHAA